MIKLLKIGKLIPATRERRYLVSFNNNKAEIYVSEDGHVDCEFLDRNYNYNKEECIIYFIDEYMYEKDYDGSGRYCIKEQLTLTN